MWGGPVIPFQDIRVAGRRRWWIGWGRASGLEASDPMGFVPCRVDGGVRVKEMKMDGDIVERIDCDSSYHSLFFLRGCH